MKTEFEKAKAWRERLDLSVRELGEEIGYAKESIYCFERGVTPGRPQSNGKQGKISAWVWLRYKRACAGLDAEVRGRKKGEKFEW